MSHSGIGVVLTCALGVGPALWAGSEPVDLQREIESAAGVLLTGGAPKEAAADDALGRLVRAASVISRELDLPESSRRMIEAVHDHSLRHSFLDERTSAALSEAYEGVNSGHRFVFPKDVASIAEAREHGRQQIERALSALKTGDSEDAARELFAFVLLVTTPMHKPH